MPLRPQDLLVALKLFLQPSATYPELADALDLSLSEAHGAAKRATEAGLLMNDREPHRKSLLEFLLHGAKFAFYPKRGRVTRGMPTAHGGPPLNQLVSAGNDPIPVWPDPDGEIRGEAFEPLYRSVPEASRKDPRLYELLCLLDAIRGGRARERQLAEKRLCEIFE